MLSTNNESFTPSFTVCVPFLSFPCLTLVARTSNTMLNTNGESRHLWPAPDFRRKAFSFSTLNMMLAGLDIYSLCYIGVHSLDTYFVVSCYHKWMLNFVECFLCICWNDHVMFMYCAMCCITLFSGHWTILHHWDESHLMMVYNPFNILLNWAYRYFIEDICIYVHQGYWLAIFFLVVSLVWVSE